MGEDRAGARAPLRRNERLRQLETELLGSPVRGDVGRLRALLHPDFVEIGRSGRRWEREELAVALLAEPPRPAPPASEWAFIDLAPALVLVTYRLDAESGGPGGSRHASVWDVGVEPPVLRFHQGTRIAAD